MSTKTLKTIIQLRRDNYTNYNRIGDTFIPRNGEVLLVDTARDGLRAKVGDGVSTYNQLDFSDNQYVKRGYYNTTDGKFYYEYAHINVMSGNESSIYIDAQRTKIYYYDGGSYVSIDEMLPSATSEVAGVMKLYHELGNNTDGTIDQKTLTENFNKKVEASVNKEDETLILSIL